VKGTGNGSGGRGRTGSHGATSVVGLAGNSVAAGGAGGAALGPRRPEALAAPKGVDSAYEWIVNRSCGDTRVPPTLNRAGKVRRANESHNKPAEASGEASAAAAAGTAAGAAPAARAGPAPHDAAVVAEAGATANEFGGVGASGGAASASTVGSARVLPLLGHMLYEHGQKVVTGDMPGRFSQHDGVHILEGNVSAFFITTEPRALDVLYEHGMHTAFCLMTNHPRPTTFAECLRHRVIRSIDKIGYVILSPFLLFGSCLCECACWTCVWAPYSEKWPSNLNIRALPSS